MTDRPKTSTSLPPSAECLGCSWSSGARNALGTAAIHHDRTGHAVQVELTRVVTFGDPTATIPGQTTIDDELADNAAAPTLSEA